MRYLVRLKSPYATMRLRQRDTLVRAEFACKEIDDAETRLPSPFEAYISPFPTLVASSHISSNDSLPELADEAPNISSEPPLNHEQDLEAIEHGSGERFESCWRYRAGLRNHVRPVLPSPYIISYFDQY